MKKNWFQNLSLALNAVLLIALFATRAELVDKQTILKSKLDDIAYRLSNMDDRITNLSAKQREQTEDLSDFSFEPTGLDPDSHTLQANMSITLRRWTADTEVTLLVTRNGQTTEQSMSGSGGVFTAPVSLSVEDTGEVSFAANITAGGQTSREEVTSYSDVAMLLPLMSNSSSLSGPVYEDGVFRMGMDIDIGLERQYGARVIDPVFQVLKNGDVVQEIPAKISESASSSAPDKDFYAPDTADERLEISCQPSDTVEIHLLCRDSFGLAYDFTTYSYEIGEDGIIIEQVWPVTDYNVEVSWD